MSSLPEPLIQLTGALNKLPGIGPRSAERLALHLVQANPELVRELSKLLVTARERIALCAKCGGLTEQQPCGICADPRRDSSVLCVVERAVDILTIEKSAVFHGKFHVLGGKISPLNGIGPEDLRIAELENRVKHENVQEVIIALPSDVEGDATSVYLAKILGAKEVKVSRIAHGLPVGSGLEYADELTLGRAIEGRRPMN